jgi:hypothetical protein
MRSMAKSRHPYDIRIVVLAGGNALSAGFDSLESRRLR